MSDLDEYLNLPEDPELQFVVYESRLRRAMWDAMSDSTSRSFDRDQKVFYATKLMAFHDAHGFDFLAKPELRRDFGDFDANFDRFTDEVTYWSTQIEVRHAQRLRPISTILKLTPELRRQLHSYINKIRETISPLQIAEKKKEALLGKLNALADEIDRDRTKTEAWTAFTLELASTGGEAARQLKPVSDLSNAIGNLFGKAKQLADDLLALPAPSFRKRIEAPQPPAPEPETGRVDDDDIPF
jgi:hypothetical protein